MPIDKNGFRALSESNEFRAKCTQPTEEWPHYDSPSTDQGAPPPGNCMHRGFAGIFCFHAGVDPCRKSQQELRSLTKDFVFPVGGYRIAWADVLDCLQQPEVPRRLPLLLRRMCSMVRNPCALACGKHRHSIKKTRCCRQPASFPCSPVRLCASMQRNEMSRSNQTGIGFLLQTLASPPSVRPFSQPGTKVPVASQQQMLLRTSTWLVTDACEQLCPSVARNLYAVRW